MRRQARSTTTATVVTRRRRVIVAAPLGALLVAFIVAGLAARTASGTPGPPQSQMPPNAARLAADDPRAQPVVSSRPRGRMHLRLTSTSDAPDAARYWSSTATHAALTIA